MKLNLDREVPVLSIIVILCGLIGLAVFENSHGAIETDSPSQKYEWCLLRAEHAVAVWEDLNAGDTPEQLIELYENNNKIVKLPEELLDVLIDDVRKISKTKDTWNKDNLAELREFTINTCKSKE